MLLMKAPLFSLYDQNKKIHTLSDYLGKWVVIYFYPRDDTPGCTKEACGFRDLSKEFEKKGAVVFGISKDSVASHIKFSNKFKLSFPVLSDESKEVIKAYGAWGQKKFLGKTFEGIIRMTFLIDPEGNIKKTYKGMDVSVHAQEILNDIESLTS